MQTYFEGEQASLFAPRYFCWENVPGCFSSGTPHGEDFRIVLESIARLHCPTVSIPRPYPWGWKPAGAIRMGDAFSLAWRGFFAEYWTLAQRRHRIFLVADLAGTSAEKVLFDYCGVSRNPAPGGGTWQAIAEGIRHCFADTSWLDWLDERQREKESK